MLNAHQYRIGNLTGQELPFPLGRNVNHDAASARFPFLAPAQLDLKAVDWTRRIPILDQLRLGSCTGNAGTGWLGTDDDLRQGLNAVDETPLDETYAIALYSAATQIDPFDGAYPPEDTGSDGLSIAKVLKARGLVTRYEHTFSHDAFLAALQRGPVLVGIPWREDMFWPDHDGYVKPTGALAGGHEIIAVSYNPITKIVGFANSWGEGWGRNGYFFMEQDDFWTLLDDDGDATVLYAVVPATPDVPPTPSPESPPFSLRSLLAAVLAWLRSLVSGEFLSNKKRP